MNGWIMSEADSPETAAEREVSHLRERERALKERGLALDRESRSFEVRASVLDERERELDERRDALDERAAADDTDGSDLVERWPLGDDLAVEFLNRYQELGTHANQNRERGVLLDQELRSKLEPPSAKDQHTLDIERRRYDLRSNELNDAISLTNDGYHTWYNDLLAHVLNDAVWEQDNILDLRLTSVWREEMTSWLRHKVQLMTEGRELNAEFDGLTRSREQLRLDAEMNQVERDKLSMDIDTFQHDLRDWHQGFAASYPIDQRVRRRWVRDIASRTKGVSQLILGTTFELFCAELLEQMGFDEVKWQGGSDDGGVDIWADEVSYSGDVTKLAIQCQFGGEHGSVGRNKVMIFRGNLSMVDRYHRAIVMTFGRIEKDAGRYGFENGVEFWDGQRLCEEMALKKLGLQFVHGPDGHELAIDGEWWDELIARAQAEHEKRKKG